MEGTGRLQGRLRDGLGHQATNPQRPHGGADIARTAVSRFPQAGRRVRTRICPPIAVADVAGVGRHPPQPKGNPPAQPISPAIHPSDPSLTARPKNMAAAIEAGNLI